MPDRYATTLLPIMGPIHQAVAADPCQLRISSASDSPLPPVVVLTLTLRTCVNPSTHQSEVAAIGCLVHHDFPLDKQPPQPPFTQHFCGRLVQALYSAFLS